ncbi:MAG: hypothetical protein JWN30_1071, partial [Bacilli bacterium]|nr:hypothetical protein [Bacilli bacterium]
SVDLPTGYTFPDLTTYNSSAPPARNKVIVPSGIGSPKQGINFYAQFAFGDKAATRHEPLLKLYDFFSIDRVLLEVAVQISDQNDSLSALLLAGFSASGQYPVSGGNGKHHLNIAAYLAIQYAQGNVSVFLRGQLTLDAPHTDNQKLTFAMELGVQENGIYAAGSMTGSWINPFDIEGLTVSDVALMVGADWEGIPSIGFAGTLTESKFNGSLACILNSEVPQQSVLAGAISNLKVGDVLDTFVHLVEPEEAAKAIIDLLNDIEINGVGSFTMPASVSDTLDHRDVQTVAQAFQTYGHVALTPTEESTLIIVGKPGQAWFITDKTNGTKHYEIYREGDHLTVSLEAQFYFTPFTTQIANLKFLQGFYVFGTLQIFGLSITSKIIISANEGVSLTERLSKIKLFGGLLSISRAPGDTRGDDSDKSASSDGPYISIASFNQPNLPSPYQTPHFFVSGALSFLGLVDLVLDIAVSSQGLHAVIKRDMFGSIFDLSIDFKPSPLTLSGGGTAGIVMNLKINLRKYGLGYYKIMNVNCTASLLFGADKDELTAHASGHLAFQVPVFDVNLGPYQVDLDLIQVDQPLTKLTTLFESAFEEMESIADDLYSVLTRDAREFVNLVKSGVLELEDTLDHVVLAIFHVNLADLTATGQCFAKARFEPHMRLLTTNGSAANDTDNELDLLRKMRTDLGTSVMGSWILSIYNTLSDPLVHLYDYIPIAPEDVTFKEVLDTYHGDEVYHQLVTMLQTTSTSQPIQLTSDFVTNSEYIVSSLIDLSDQYASSGDATRVHEAALIKQGVTALLNQFPSILEYANQGLNYEQLLQKLNGMTPPSNPFNS